MKIVLVFILRYEAVDATDNFKVGGSCKVLIKKKVYTGEIAALGKIFKLTIYI